MTTQAWYMRTNATNGVVFIQPERADRFILTEGGMRGLMDGVDLYTSHAAEDLRAVYAARNADDWDLSGMYTDDYVFNAPVGDLFDDPDTEMTLVAEFDYDDDFAEVIV